MENPMPWLPPDCEKMKLLSADYFAADVDQRSTGITGVDGGIGLEKVVAEFAGKKPFAGTDDPLGDRFLQSERIADGEHQLPDTHLLGIRKRQRPQILSVDLQHGQIGLRIGPEQPCRKAARVAQAGQNFIGSLDDMHIGHDVTLG